AQQIKKLNFRWAATEAAGLGVVDGAVEDGEMPTVRYNTNLFDTDGKVHLAIQRPSDRACMFCHTMSGVQKRGTAWHSQFIQDVHTDQGLSCVDCHTSDIRHNFAKGCSSSQTVRDDLDNTMLSCEQCHYESRELGAPAYDHPGIPPIHLERLSCEACHIANRPFLTARVVDSLTGKVIELPNALDTEPAVNLMYGARWGTLDLEEASALVPFSPQQIAAAADFAIAPDAPIRATLALQNPSLSLPEGAFSVRDFVEDGGSVELVDTAEKRALMLFALEQTAAPGDGAIVACLFRGVTYHIMKGRLFELKTELKPRRVGQLAEYPVTPMMHRVDGKDVIQPAGYQLGVFWAHEDANGQIRPLFPRDMEAAWNFIKLSQLPPDTGQPGEENFQHFFLPPTPPGAEPVELPNPAEAGVKAYRGAVGARLKQYGNGPWPTLEGVWDDNNDRWEEVNTEEEMGVIAWAIVRTMKRLQSNTLYYIKGTNAYRVTVTDPQNPFSVDYAEIEPLVAGEPYFIILKRVWDEDGKRWRTVDLRPMRNFSYTVEPVEPATNPQLAALAQRLPWTISHGVEPAGQALGAKSCADCHSMDSPFFFTSVLVDPFDAQGQPVSVPAYELLGFTLDGLQAAAWREQWVKPIAPWAVLLVLLAIVLHYTILGPRQENKEYVVDVQRFSFIERTLHLVLMGSVAYLSATGFCFLLGVHDPLGEWSRELHALTGYVASGAMALVFLRWFVTMRPQKGDITWLLHMGGYLGGKGHYPAHKFNAGQKILFWKAVGLMAVLIATGILMALQRDGRFPLQQWLYFIHDAAALLMILLLLGHIYLAVLANPHSVRSLFGGKVSSEWAKEHHPDWTPKGRE
ncbi:MAG: cytochrome b/b6 domain-containing protein, partial [Candidatus Hydrogenedentes bacterium]|nr:cytochrome b/b6 domain-containing protein [Candidatus Hydrogenedentota bacterium]